MPSSRADVVREGGSSPVCVCVQVVCKHSCGSAIMVPSSRADVVREGGSSPVCVCASCV